MSCPSVRPSAWNNLVPAGQIFMKFDIWLFFEKLEKIQVSLKTDKITRTLRADRQTDRHTFVITSRSVLLRIRNVWGKGCKGNQNARFVFSNVFRKSCILWDNVEKYCTAGQAKDDNMMQVYYMLDNYRGADKSLARPNWKNNWKVAFFFRRGGHCCRGDLFGWTTIRIVFEWLAKVRVWSLYLVSFLVGLRTYQTHGFTYALAMCNTYCFFTATMVARMPRDITYMFSACLVCHEVTIGRPCRRLYLLGYTSWFAYNQYFNSHGQQCARAFFLFILSIEKWRV